MTDFLDEEVPPVQPLSVAALEEVGRVFLEQLAPEVLSTPQALNVIKLVDDVLPQFGVHVLPASREELGHRAGATDPKGDREVDILVSEDVWDDLLKPAPRCYFARTTICHEIGHAVLHVPVLRRRLLLTDGLARVERRSLRAYEDPEWQAWTFAGCLLMPSPALRILSEFGEALTLDHVSSTFEVSLKMARSHLTRLKWCQFEG